MLHSIADRLCRSWCRKNRVDRGVMPIITRNSDKIGEKMWVKVLQRLNRWTQAPFPFISRRGKDVEDNVLQSDCNGYQRSYEFISKDTTHLFPSTGPERGFTSEYDRQFMSAFKEECVVICHWRGTTFVLRHKISSWDHRCDDTIKFLKLQI